MRQGDSRKIAKALFACVLAGALLAGCIKPEEPVPPSSSIEEVSEPELPTGVRGTGEISFDDGVELTMEQQELMLDYMDRYYESLAHLSLQDPSELFEDAVGAQAIGNRTAWEYLIALRGMQRTDLALASYQYKIVCRELEEQEDGDIQVLVTEHSTQNFVAYPGVDSEFVVIYHTFILTDTAEGWRIRSHMQMDSLYYTLLGTGDSAADQGVYERPWFEVEAPEAFFAERLAALLEQAKGDVALRGEPTTVSLPAVKPEKVYDRFAAVRYAEKWVGYRNKAWPDYGWNGGNCQNFVSQSLLAGGIPMDREGTDVWKWYSDTPDNGPEETGRSSSWSAVEQFRAYAEANNGFGLAGRVDVPYYGGEVGDVLNLGMPGDWHHCVLITEVLKDENGRTVDYLVSSNTADVRCFPASAYFYTHQSLLRIDGWNDVAAESEAAVA